MQDYITKESLLSLDLDLGTQDIDALVATLNDTLEERVGTALVDALDEMQLEEFVELQESATDEAIGAWLEKHVPEFDQILQNETESVLEALTEDLDNEVA